jgi:hypothetical protein
MKMLSYINTQLLITQDIATEQLSGLFIGCNHSTEVVTMFLWTLGSCSVLGQREQCIFSNVAN